MSRDVKTSEMQKDAFSFSHDGKQQLWRNTQLVPSKYETAFLRVNGAYILITHCSKLYSYFGGDLWILHVQ